MNYTWHREHSLTSLRRWHENCLQLASRITTLDMCDFLGYVHTTFSNLF